jgi:hypothetical protein
MVRFPADNPKGSLPATKVKKCVKTKYHSVGQIICKPSNHTGLHCEGVSIE